MATNVNYKIILNTGEVQAFEKLEMAVLFAKEHHISFIDVCERKTGDVIDFIQIRLRSKVAA
jgi:hypothetical protein